MLTLSALMRATRQMRAFGELPLPPVPRDRSGGTRRADAAPAFPGAAKGEAPRDRRARVWDEEKGAFLLKDVGPDAGDDPTS